MEKWEKIKCKKSIEPIVGELQKLLEECLSSDKVGHAFGLTHACGCQRDDDGVVLEEGDDGDAAKFHVKLLLLHGIDLALGLVHLEEVLDDRLVHIVTDGVLDLLHVEIELADGAGG